MGILTPKQTLSFLILLNLSSLVFTADNTNVVYKGCSQQKLQQQSSQNLQSLLSSLVSASGQKTFAATTTGDVTGAYQCRGDLSTSDCYLCVSKIPSKISKLCGNVAAVKIQLSGCYLRYEVVGFKQVPMTQFLYKVCRVARFIKQNLICQYGIPDRIITDNGTNLNNSMITALCE